MLYYLAVECSFVYAKCTRIECQLLWSDLMSISNYVVGCPWLVGGDFHIISILEEYFGNASQDLGAMANFDSFVSNCSFFHLPTIGSSCTCTILEMVGV